MRVIRALYLHGIFKYKTSSYVAYRKGYEADATFKKIATLKETTYALNGVMTGKTSSFYVNVKNDHSIGQPSEVIRMNTNIKEIVKLSIKQVINIAFKLNWNKSNGGTRHIIYRKRNDNKMKKVLTLGEKN